LTDVFFAHVLVVPFTGDPSNEQEGLAFTLLRYFTFFPVVTALSLISEHLAEKSWLHFGAAMLIVVVAHLWFRQRHRDAVRLHCAQPALEEGEEEFPMKLGLRY
jgi:hypothetical protein